MSSLFFWQSWAREYRYTWFVVATVFVAAMLFMWYGYFFGADTVMHWENLQEQKAIQTTVHSFRLGPFVLSVPAESYAILENIQGSQTQPNVPASYASLFILAFSLTVLIAVITTLGRIWFLVGAALFSLLIFTLRLEVIGIFGIYHQAVGIVVIAAYLIAAFYFEAIRPSTPLVIRIAVFFAITLTVGLVAAFFSREPVPFYHLVLTSFPAAIILSLIFMILVAHEIFASFVYIATSQGSSRSIRHLSLLCAIYLVNLMLTLAHELKIVDFDFIYINIFLLLTLSAILGIWGFRSRESVYGNIISFNPFGAILYICLGAICFGTLADHLCNANDAAVRALRHAVLFTQCGYGVIFLLYLLANFGQLLTDDKPVYKIMYQPTRMPYFTFRLAGFIATLAIFIYGGWRSYVFDSVGAFYTIAGDFNRLKGDEETAIAFYEKAGGQAFGNHRANYTLAMMHLSRYNFPAAQEFMEMANLRRPTDFSLVNRGILDVREGEVRKSTAHYRSSLKTSLEIPQLFNNLGVSYTKLRNLDSALFFLSQAREKEETRIPAETNFFALAALEMVPLDIDSIYENFDNSSTAVLANVYALASVLNKPATVGHDPLRDKQLDLYTATYLNNYILQNVKTLDTAFTAAAYKIASDPANASFSEALKSALAYAYYHQDNIAKALEILAEQVYRSQSYQGTFNYIMGLWALEQRNAEKAATYFNYADSYAHKEAPFYRAIALTEAGVISEALAAWDTVLARNDPGKQDLAMGMKRILTMSAAEATELVDASKYQFCRYRLHRGDSLTFDRISPTFTNDNYLAQALLDFSGKYLEHGDIIPAIRYYQQVAGLKLTDQRLYDDVRHFELRLLAARRDLRGLATQINKGIEFGAGRKLEKIYYTALMNEASGDTVAAAKNYRVLATYNPYFEDGVIAAFYFFRDRSADAFEAYSILAEAVQVNDSSIPLLREYHQEAMRIGFDEYAATAYQRILELEARQR